MLRVGLTGGIGAGKSEVVAAAGRATAPCVIDADAVAREVVAPGTPGPGRGRRGVRRRTCCAATARLDRDRLGEIVFADPDAAHEAERDHPPAGRRADAPNWSAAAAAAAIVVHDIPLLAENQPRRAASTWSWWSTCRPRVQAGAAGRAQRGMTRDAGARPGCAAQATREERLAIADHRGRQLRLAGRARPARSASCGPNCAGVRWRRRVGGGMTASAAAVRPPSYSGG